ncbi:uncharacterized protein LOC113229229 [Hyposmocoma kahamanoa]|uniref:uncharacterized protein LOC113229229 n=1 Tax=Hyposmocoma kahamanoa TaxID=1477025 RepID=UPI000E6D8DBC|nr:uncharacterized protein LOC113229229 [Hyposmocoma kahamanoa]
MKRRDKAKSILSDDNLLSYKRLRNLCNRLCRDAKRRYIHSPMEGLSMGQTWKFLRSLGVGKDRDYTVDLPDLKSLNKYFTNSQFTVADSIKTSTLTSLGTVARPAYEPFSFREVTEGEVKKSILSITCKAVGEDVSICLRIVGTSVPSLKQRGESATLTCDYDLEGGRLYSVKWYRDNEEFYRYMPKLIPPQHAHRLDGVKVDLDKSSARRVHLRDLTLRSRGLYRCEVSEEAPSFHSAQAEALMEIYYFPKEGPRITGHDRSYILSEPLDVNCSSAKAFPAPELQWLIDGQKVTERTWLIAYGARPAAQGLLVSTLGLRAPMKRRMRLRCIASIGTHRREKTVVIGKLFL